MVGSKRCQSKLNLKTYNLEIKKNKKVTSKGDKHVMNVSTILQYDFKSREKKLNNYSATLFCVYGAEMRKCCGNCTFRSQVPEHNRKNLHRQHSGLRSIVCIPLVFTLPIVPFFHRNLRYFNIRHRGIFSRYKSRHGSVG